MCIVLLLLFLHKTPRFPKMIVAEFMQISNDGQSTPCETKERATFSMLLLLCEHTHQKIKQSWRNGDHLTGFLQTLVVTQCTRIGGTIPLGPWNPSRHDVIRKTILKIRARYRSEECKRRRRQRLSARWRNAVNDNRANTLSHRNTWAHSLPPPPIANNGLMFFGGGSITQWVVGQFGGWFSRGRDKTKDGQPLNSHTHFALAVVVVGRGRIAAWL